MNQKRTIFFLSEDLDSHSTLIDLLGEEFEVTCYHKAADMKPRIIPSEVPDVFIFDYSRNGYTENMAEAVKSIRHIDRTAIIFGLFSIFDETDGKQALIDGCTDVINCMSVDYIVKKSAVLCRSKDSLTKRTRRVTSVL